MSIISKSVKNYSRLLLASFVVAALHFNAASAQDNSITFNREITVDKFAGLTPPTPIAITGFPSEIEHVLNFDLTVMGFIQVPYDGAQYVLSGSANGNVQGQLSFGKTIIFSQLYNGASARAQAHRLADDVVLKLTGVRGIAETKIAFAGYDIHPAPVGKTGEIYVSDFDGFGAQAVTRDEASVGSPHWVPGHLALFYTTYKTGTPNIFYQNLVSRERKNFAHYGGMNSGGVVSPDGNRVAMTLSKNGSPEIWICDINGGDLKQLTSTKEASSPCWSPDGQWICFNARLDGRLSLFKVSPGGGQIHRISTDGVGNPTEPDWSPDGKWIAFTSQASGFSICVVPSGGGSATPLVSGEDPSWSPNSRTLVFARRDGEGNRRLSLLDVPTKQVKDANRVSGSHLNNSQPGWAK